MVELFGRPWVGTAGRWCDCRLGLAVQADFEGLALPKHALQDPKRCTALLGHSCVWLNNGWEGAAQRRQRGDTVHCTARLRREPVVSSVVISAGKPV